MAEPGAASWTDVRDTAPEFQREVASSPEPVSGAAQEMSAAEQQLDSQAEEPTEKAAVVSKGFSNQSRFSRRAWPQNGVQHKKQPIWIYTLITNVN